MLAAFAMCRSHGTYLLPTDATPAATNAVAAPIVVMARHVRPCDTTVDSAAYVILPLRPQCDCCTNSGLAGAKAISLHKDQRSIVTLLYLNASLFAVYTTNDSV